MIREYLPRVCLNINSNKRNKFDINIILNDYRMTKISSYFKNTIYKYKLYNYSFVNEPTYYDDSFKEKYEDIRVNQLTNSQNIYDSIQIDNLDIGMYLLEINVIENSSLCDGVNMCAVESNINNQIDCVECSKLVVHFVLEQNMLNNKIKEINDSFKCSIDNQISMINRKYRLFNRKNFVKYDINSFVLTVNFSLSGYGIMMPYFKINIPTKKSYFLVSNLPLIICIFFMLVILLILFQVIYLIKQNHQCNPLFFLFGINYINIYLILFVLKIILIKQLYSFYQ
jgi:hypothetical protein